MRNSTSQKLRIVFLLGFFLLCLTTLQAQVTVPFTMRKTQQIKGDIAMIGNNIVNRKTDPTTTWTGPWWNPTQVTVPGRDPNTAFPDTGESNSTANDNFNMRYIDVDGDATTFSSSKATLTIPDLTCSKVAYAALYWSATYRYNNSDGTGGRNTDFNVIKLKLPGASAYTTVTGTKIYDGFTDTVNTALNTNSPYGCYADVTALLQGLANPNGEYTVADIRVTQGTLGGGGISGGWNLYVVYENPTLSGKHITSFDGFAGVSSGLNGGNGVDVTYSGFTTVPSPLTVNAKLATAGLEGDNQISGDRLKFKSGATAFNDLSNTYNPAGNFFNANITILTDDPATLGIYDETIPTLFTARVPSSTNTLGFDSDVIRIPSGYLPNSATSATLRMISTQDTYFMYFNALAIDVIEPEISLIKTVENAAQQPWGGMPVTLGDPLTYVLTLENIGNDHAVGLTITDVLPVNTSYLNVDMSDVPGATATPTYNPATGRTTVVFTIPDALVKKKGTTGMGPREIRINVKIAETCNELTDRCANIIQNSASAAYHGFENTLPVVDTSVTGIGSCGAPTLGPANFLVDVDDCEYARTEILCNPPMTLTAGDGYDGYRWYMKGILPSDPDIELGTSQTLSVNIPGIYYVDNDAAPPCLDLTEIITVSLDDDLVGVNPIAVAGIADEWGACPNDGRITANIFLCGINDTRFIPSGVTTGTVSWQKLNPVAGCNNPVPNFCPHNALICEPNWIEIATGPNYTATTEGEYRLRIDNGGCSVTYYFNVFKNYLDPKVDTQDIVCTTPGEITVVNVPAGYEYRLLTQAGVQVQPAAAGTYTTNPVFPIAAVGIYKVELRQVGVTDGCLFEIPNIGIAQKTMTVNVTKVDKTCNIPGSINIQALGVDQQYTFKITGPGGIVSTHGPLTNSNDSFSGLIAGTYTVEVTTEDGCLYSNPITINDYSNLALNAVVTQSPSCDPGYITLTPSGGQPAYSFAYYSINGVLQNPGLGDYTLTSPVEILSSAVGTYVFITKDANGCTVLSNPVTINNIPPVTTTSISQNVSCNGATDGNITFTITANNGFTVYFELLDSSDAVITTNASGIFNNLAPGSYSVVVVQQGTLSTCRATPVPFTISQPTALAGTASVTLPLTCAPAGATITAGTPTGGTPFGGAFPYQYSINGINFVNSNTFTGLTAGTYSVTIKDARGCTYVTAPMTLTAPVQVTDITFSGTPVVCSALTSNVTLTAVGGLAPFTYAITAPSVVNNGASATFAGLAPGTYTFTVTDAKGCTFSKNYTINPITLISVVGQNVNNVICSGTATGAAKFTVSGFGTAFNYSVVSTGTAVAPATGVTTGVIDLTNLAAGTYTITVVNTTTNCTATAAVTILNPTAVLAVTKNVVQPNCTVTTGSVTITATGGWGAKQYALSGAATVGPQASNSFTGLAAGSYTLSAIDANGCIVTDTFTITAPVTPVLSITASDLCLAGGTSITVNVNAATGVAPFQFRLDGGTYQNGDTATGKTFTGLTAGNHTVTVRDANGCTYTTSAQTVNPLLTAASAFAKALDCTASPDAEITVTVAGGATPYQYQVSYNAGAFGTLTAFTPANGNIINYTTAVAGTYQFRITDAAGCTVTTGTTTIAPLVLPEFAFGTTTDVLCNGASTGALVVNIDTTKGISPYTISVTNTDTSNNYGSQLTGLPAGNYDVTITDGNGCTFTDSEEIKEKDPITFTTHETNIQCIDDPTNPGTNISAGEILVQTVAGGTGPYTYELTNNFGYAAVPVTTAATSHPFVILNYGIYQVVVRDANGCIAVKQNIIMASPPNELAIDVSTLPSTCADGGTAVVTVGAIITGTNYEFAILETNTPPYTSQAYVGPDNPMVPRVATFDGLTPGVTYTFVVYDTDTHCYYFAPQTIPLTISDMVVAPLVVNQTTCTGANDGNVNFNFTGATNATSVTYQVYEAQSNEIVATVGASGTVTPTAGSGSGSVTGLAPGFYYIQFEQVGGTNAGCQIASAQFSITQSVNPLIVTATATEHDNTCTALDGKIVITGQGGTPTYTYQVVTAGAPQPVTWQASNTFNLESGSYDAYIKDSNNCIRKTAAAINVILDPLPAITVTIDDECTPTEGNFAIDVVRTVNGSVGPYTYSLNGGAFQSKADSFSYTNLNSGTYTVVIKDGNGCTFSATAVTIHAPIGVTAQPTVQPTCPANVGEITAVGTGGSLPANLRYELQTAAGVSVLGPQVSPVFTGLAAGNYKV